MAVSEHSLDGDEAGLETVSHKGDMQSSKESHVVRLMVSLVELHRAAVQREMNFNLVNSEL